MTTIAWDGKSLAADRRISADAWTAGTRKLVKTTLADGRKVLVGACGELDHCRALLDWVAAGMEPEDWPDVPNAEAIVVIDGECFYAIGETLSPITDPFVAIGSGSAYAMGAMACGKGAKFAVSVAARFDPATGNGVDVVRWMT